MYGYDLEWCGLADPSAWGVSAPDLAVRKEAGLPRVRGRPSPPLVGATDGRMGAKSGRRLRRVERNHF